MGRERSDKKKRGSRRRSVEQAPAAPSAPFTAEAEAAALAWAKIACEERGLVLLDAEFSAPPRPALRLTIDLERRSSPGDALPIEACVGVSRALEERLDEAPGVPEDYTIEVSSPGVERALRRPEHFRQEIGRAARLVSRESVEGAYAFEGTIARVSPEGAVTLTLEDGRELEFESDVIKKARLVYDFDA